MVLCPCYAESLKSCTKIGVSLDVAISLVLQNFPCSCKNWSEATKDVKGLGLYKLAKSPCTCGASQSRQCKSSHHLKALDGQAAAYTETGKLDAACRTAERMLQMAPTELDVCYGYLCCYQMGLTHCFNRHTIATRKSSGGETPRVR